VKLLFSKLPKTEDTFSIDKKGNTLGHTQLCHLMIRHDAVEVEVSIAGTIIVEPFEWPDRVLAEGAIESIEDVESDSPTGPEELRVQGLANITFADGTTRPLPFAGILYTTGYLRRAWLCVLDPNWDHSWDF
jgi:hypothetical protein